MHFALTRRLKSSCSRSIALALGINFDRVYGYRKKVNSRAPTPSRARVATRAATPHDCYREALQAWR